jgi:NitT/TauT family transport system substrate-binding protein
MKRSLIRDKTSQRNLVSVSKLNPLPLGEERVRALNGNPMGPHLNPALRGDEVKIRDKKNCGLSFASLIILSVILWPFLSVAAEKLEKLRAAYPAIAPGSTPSWITAEKRIWQKYGLEVEPILVSGGARAVPALLGQSVQFLFGSDTGVTTAQLQGIPVVRLGVTMNTLGSSLLTHPNVQSVQDLKGKILGISRGRDASYIRLAKLLRDNGLNPNEDVKFLSIGGGEGGRLSALKAGVIHGTMLFPPMDLIARNEGLKVLQKFDVPTPGGGINTTVALLKQNRPLVVNFLKGYIEGIHYMNRNKDDSLKILQRYFHNSDMTAMGYLYDETTRRLEKELRANPESIRFHLDMAALDDPRAAKLSEKDFWDASVVEEIRRSGFIDQLYKK